MLVHAIEDFGETFRDGVPPKWRQVEGNAFNLSDFI